VKGDEEDHQALASGLQFGNKGHITRGNKREIVSQAAMELDVGRFRIWTIQIPDESLERLPQLVFGRSYLFLKHCHRCAITQTKLSVGKRSSNRRLPAAPQEYESDIPAPVDS
jgi:hypothetical protein